MNTHPTRQPAFDGSPPSGFTLLEMMITLMIFVLLTAAVFGIVTGVLNGSSTLLDNQNRRDQIAALNAFLKKKLGELPAQSGLESYQRLEGEGVAQSGIVLADPRAALVIDAEAQANGFYTLRLARYPIPVGANLAATVQNLIPLVTSNDSSISWIPLIHDVKYANWKFQALNLTNWVDEWDDIASKPNLIELSMQQAADVQPVAMDFWIPRVETVQLAISNPSDGGDLAANPDASTTNGNGNSTSKSTTSGDTGIARIVTTVNGQTILKTSPAGQQ